MCVCGTHHLEENNTVLSSVSPFLSRFEKKKKVPSRIYIKKRDPYKALTESVRMRPCFWVGSRYEESYGPISTTSKGTSSHSNPNISATTPNPPTILADIESSLSQLFYGSGTIPISCWESLEQIQNLTKQIRDTHPLPSSSKKKLAAV